MSHHHLLRLIPRIRIRHSRSPIPNPQLRFSSSSSSTTTLRTRVQTLHNRLPRFLHPYTAPLLSAPKTYIVAFLLLHEITAIVPLFTLAGAFHYTGWLPTDMVPREKVEGGVRRFEKWFRRRGWFGYGAEEVGIGRRDEAGGEMGEKLDKIVRGGEEGNWRGKRIVLEVATAYAITKVLLPVRIAVSVWGAPWFAKVMGRVGSLVGRVKRKSV
ncbi:family FLILHELTA protein [Rutstroemia sp. NJR-2017a BVV2]|nr:family FLILHELTA protein [Rutstroemia sp. NJR-2017a BVV2]PQE08237.1 family FLILHELTA protein [Rutstroemia sp. NJR-2017a BVV2]